MNLRALAGRFIFPQVLLPPASGASLGFFVWTLETETADFEAYFIFNSIAEASRQHLIFFIIGGALVVSLAWMFIQRMAESPQNEKTAFIVQQLMYLGLSLGMLPILNIRALEVYHPYFVFCLIAVLLTIILKSTQNLYRLSGRATKIENTERICRLLLILSVAGYAVFFGFYTVLKHRSFHSYAFDLGWQNQVFFTLLKTGIPTVTGYITIPHLSNHFQPLYYLLAPIYALYRHPEILLLLQSIALPIGAVPLYLLARNRTGSPWLALALSLVFLLYPPLHGLNSYDFHGLVFLIPIGFFLLYFLDSGKMRLFWIFLILGLITREDTAITLSGLGLYTLFVLKNRKLGVSILAVCAGYFVLTLTFMSALNGFANLENYWALVIPERQNFLSAILTLLSNPFYVLRHVFFNPDKLTYLVQIFLPVLLLPFFSGRRMLVAVPGFAVILLSGTAPQYSIGFQYSAHLIPFVFYLTLYGIDSLRKQKMNLRGPVLALPLLLAGVFMNYEYGLMLSKRFPGFQQPTVRENLAHTFFREIPDEAAVATISRLYPHLSGRERIYLLNRMQPDTEYILADIYPASPATDLYERVYRSHALSPSEIRRQLQMLLKGQEFGVVHYDSGFVLLRRGHEPSRNKEVLHRIETTITPKADPIISYYRHPTESAADPIRSQSDLLEAFLRENRNSTLLLVSAGEATGNLTYMCLKYLMISGSGIHTLREGGAIVAVLKNDRIVFERIDNKNPVLVHSRCSKDLLRAFSGVTLSLGTRSGAAVINIAGRDYASDKPGLHVVVLNHLNKVTAYQVFSTGGSESKKVR